VAPPSPPREKDDEPPSDLNIAILPNSVPLGNMAPPPSTTIRPTFGIQSADAPKTKVKGKKGKVALTPGHSALDWARLCSSGEDLRGTAIPMRVTLAELKKVSRDGFEMTFPADRESSTTPKQMLGRCLTEKSII
jgi:hypothetical protein